MLRVLMPGEMTYEKWAGIFAPQWMKMLTFAAIVSIAITHRPSGALGGLFR